MACCVPLINSLKSMTTIDLLMIVILGFNDEEKFLGNDCRHRNQRNSVH